MAFRIEGDESIAAALRRIAVEQFGEGISEIDDQGLDRYEAVHQIRRRLKRVRGILRMARESFPKTYRRENGAYRDAAQALAPFRDAQSAIEAFEAFRKRFRAELAGEPLAKIRARLEEVKSETDPGDDELANRLAQTRAKFEEFRERAHEWKFDRDGFRAIEAGLFTLYDAGDVGRAAAFKAAKREPFASETTVAFHEWRKSVKYLGFAMRILTPVWKTALDARRRATDALEKKLGEEHDLALLCERVANEKERLGLESEAERFFPLAERRRTELRESARGIGARFYAEPPDAFVNRLRAYWKIRQGELRSAAATNGPPPPPVQEE